MARQAIEDWMKNDVYGFRARLVDANRAFAEKLETIALSRIEKPEGSRGSDQLLEFLLRAANPEKYRVVPVVVDTGIQEFIAVLKGLGTRKDRARESSNTIEGEIVRDPLSGLLAYQAPSEPLTDQPA